MGFVFDNPFELVVQRIRQAGIVPAGQVGVHKPEKLTYPFVHVTVGGNGGEAKRGFVRYSMVRVAVLTEAAGSVTAWDLSEKIHAVLVPGMWSVEGGAVDKVETAPPTQAGALNDTHDLGVAVYRVWQRGKRA